MNNLNNNQLILLALLVSFVTSIATGIFTVTLIDQAPPSVVNTIDRVVERTVERVVPTRQETIVKERVVVDKGGDLVVAAVEKVSPALVSIYSLGDDDGEGAPEIKEGIGFFIGGDGRLLAFMKSSKKELFVKNSKIRIPVTLIKNNEALGLALYNIAKNEGDEPSATPIQWQELKLAGTDVQVGQTAIVLNTGTIAVSFVSGLVKDEGEVPYYRLYLDKSDTLVGAPVINVKEEVIGILKEENQLITAETIFSFLKEGEGEKKNTEKPGTADTGKEKGLDS